MIQDHLHDVTSLLQYGKPVLPQLSSVFMNHHSNSSPHLPSSAIYFRRLADVPFDLLPAWTCLRLPWGTCQTCQTCQTTIELSGKWKQMETGSQHFASFCQMSCKCLTSSGQFRLEEPRCEGPLPPVYRSPDSADSADLEIWKLADSIALTNSIIIMIPS